LNKNWLEEIKNNIKNATLQGVSEMLEEMIDLQKLEDQIERYEALPKQIQQQELYIANLQEGINEDKLNLDMEEAAIRQAINEEQGANGKPKYSNEASRSGEFNRRITVEKGNHEEYWTARNEYSEASEKLTEAKATLRQHENMFIALKTVLAVQAAKLNALSGLV